MPKKIIISNETNELNFLFGGYFSYGGCVTLRKKKNTKASYCLTIALSFDDMKIAKLFQESFGGCIEKKSKRFPEHWTQSPSKITKNIRWRISGVNLNDFISAIEPYLIGINIKKKIKIAKEFHKYQQRNFQGRSKKVRDERHKFYLQMSIL